MQVSMDPADTAVIVQHAAEPKEMLGLSKLPDGRTLVKVNFSSLSIMQECWRKTEYSLVRGLRSNLESSATLFGTAIHKGLEVFYQGKRTERHIPKHYTDTMQMIGCGAWEPDWSESLLFRAAREFVLKAQPLSQLPADNKRSINTGVWLLQHYFSHYVTDPFVVYEDTEGPVTERKVRMVVHEDEKKVIELFGQIDVVLRNEVTGIILPCDHKTTTQLGSTFYQRLHPNFQYTAYLWASREILKLDTDSFLVNAIQVKAPPKTSRGSPPDFARQVTSRTQEDFEELRTALVYYTEQYLSNLERNHWPQTAPNPCSNYGGCQYLEVCAAPAQLRENVIKAKYSERNV